MVRAAVVAVLFALAAWGRAEDEGIVAQGLAVDEVCYV